MQYKYAHPLISHIINFTLFHTEYIIIDNIRCLTIYILRQYKIIISIILDKLHLTCNYVKFHILVYCIIIETHSHIYISKYTNCQ